MRNSEDLTNISDEALGDDIRSSIRRIIEASVALRARGYSSVLGVSAGGTRHAIADPQGMDIKIFKTTSV